MADADNALRRLQVQYAITRVLAESLSLDTAIPDILRILCEGLDWCLSAMWVVEPDDGVLRLAETFHSQRVAREATAAMFARRTFEKGAGLPGRVWATREPHWIPDLAADTNFPRAGLAARAGLQSGAAFPIVFGRSVLGVLELFSAAPRHQDDDLLNDLSAIGSQIGQFVERRRAERALVESEQNHRAVLEAALDCIITMDHRGTILEFNPAAVATFGYAREDAVGREMCTLMVPPALRDLHRRGLARYLETGVGNVIGRRIEIAAMHADGHEFPVELTITRLPSEGPPIFAGFVRDITERRQYETELSELLEREQAARQEAEAASRVKDEFLTTLSHELRTPLTAISGWARMLRTGSLDVTKRDRALETIERNADVQARLIADLLDMSAILAGRIRLECAMVDAGAVIQTAAESARPAAQAKGVDLVVAAPADRFRISADAVRLQQIVGNLVSNAVKFTPAGGRVSVTAEERDAWLEIVVRDTGKGISAEFLPKVFDRFTQENVSPSRSSSGIGLGLAIVRTLVGLHGGTVHAESPGDNQGAVFRVRLPRPPAST